jgi:L-ascorbate metabolism protein UlaG (beta-lactamase superfamily)
VRIIHFGHSCVLLETGSARLLIDPGTWSTGYEVARELDAVLITHQHPDHLDTGKLPAVLAANPKAVLVVDEGSAPVARELGVRATVLRPGEDLRVGGSVVRVAGGRHAVIHEDVPIIPNNGYIVDDGAFYHPGDSLVVPEADVDVLGLPMAAPWCKTSETVEFLRALHPRTALPIHQAVLGGPGPALYTGLLERLAPQGTTISAPPHAEPADL